MLLQLIPTIHICSGC